MIAILFWASIGLIVYTFAGYPIALAILGSVRPKPWRRSESEPSISVVISAYNEEAAVANKIRNLLSLDYPADRLEILAGSDGSTDRTGDELRSVEDARVRPFVFENRRGKPSVLNALVPQAKGEIVVMSDVRQTFEPATLRAFARSFADPSVGVVSGEVMLRTESTSAGEGAGVYWRYETFTRRSECVIDSTIGATGPIYAIRKALFTPIPADTILDDVLIPMRVARHGYRIVVDEEARAIDRAYAHPAQEFTRKVRTIAGNFQLFARERWLMNPFANRLWWQTMSHKALRLAIAPLQLTAIVANLMLLGVSPLYKIAMSGQILFYAAAVAGCLLPRNWKKPVLVTFPYFFSLLSWATVLAFLRSISGRQPVTWQKAN